MSDVLLYHNYYNSVTFEHRLALRKPVSSFIYTSLMLLEVVDLQFVNIAPAATGLCL